MKTVTWAWMVLCISTASFAGQHVLGIRGATLHLNEQAFKIIGLRCSNALISDETADRLIASLDRYKSYGVNTVSVFFMGSRFGDVKGYRPDASLDPLYAKRMARIIEAADERGMVVIVGCLYWSVSRAKEDLGHWTQVEANRAVANTVRWLVENRYRNVILDPDNEGMAGRDRGWSTEALIAAAHAVSRAIAVANNTRQEARNADLNMHFGPKESGKPWFDSEATPEKTPQGYWGRFSKDTYQNDNSYYNYSRIGRYTAEMKAEQLRAMRQQMEQTSGYVFASTWLQCGPSQGIHGPFTALGGRSNLGSNSEAQAAWNRDIDTLHPEAGVRWWFEFVKEHYGPWRPSIDRWTWHQEREGQVSIEAETFSHQSQSTYTRYRQPHRWVLKTDRPGYSGAGFLQVLPDEWPEGGTGPSSPRDNTGARLTYPIHVTQAGQYRVYVRGLSMGGESNGVHVGVDDRLAGRGPGASNLSGFRPHHQWVWEHRRKHDHAQPAVLTLREGRQLLHVWNRDDGFCMDKIVLRPLVGGK